MGTTEEKTNKKPTKTQRRVLNFSFRQFNPTHPCLHLTLAGLLESIAQPVESFVETITRGGARGLNELLQWNTRR